MFILHLVRWFPLFVSTWISLRINLLRALIEVYCSAGHFCLGVLFCVYQKWNGFAWVLYISLSFSPFCLELYCLIAVSSTSVLSCDFRLIPYIIGFMVICFSSRTLSRNLVSVGEVANSETIFSGRVISLNAQLSLIHVSFFKVVLLLLSVSVPRTRNHGGTGRCFLLVQSAA